MLFTSFQGKEILSKIPYPTNFLLLCEDAKNSYSNMQDCRIIITIYFFWIKKKTLSKDIYWNTGGWAKTQRKEKIIIANSTCYMLGTLPGPYSNSLKPFCANQWGSYYYYSSFPVRSMKHREVHFPVQNHTVNKKWYQDLNCSILDFNFKPTDLTPYCL